MLWWMKCSPVSVWENKSTAEPPEIFGQAFYKRLAGIGAAPQTYLFLPKMQEGKEKQSGGLFFRRGTHMRGPPRTAAGGAYFATLPDCRTQRPVYTWRLNFDFLFVASFPHLAAEL